MDNDVEIVPKEENDMDNNVDEEVDAIDGGYGEDWHKVLLEEDDDNVYEDDDYCFTDSLFMQCTLMTNLCAACVFKFWNLC